MPWSKPVLLLLFLTAALSVLPGIAALCPNAELESLPSKVIWDKACDPAGSTNTNGYCLGQCVTGGNIAQATGVTADCGSDNKWRLNGQCRSCTVSDLTNDDPLYQCAGTAHGAICTYTRDCLVGEELVQWEEDTNWPNSTVECMDGTWQKLAYCDTVYCNGKPPNSITHFTWDCTDSEYAYGSNCTSGSCAASYQPTQGSPPVATCNGRNWNLTGSCSQIAAPLSPCQGDPTTESYRNWDWDCPTSTSSGSTCTLGRCKVEFEKDPSDPPTATCTNGTWKQTGYCVRPPGANCTTPPPNNMRTWTWNCPGPYPYLHGSNCTTGTCDPGYVPIAGHPNVAKCNRGEFVLTGSGCERGASCSGNPSGPGMTFRCSTGTTLSGDTCIARCRSGFSPSSPPPVATCLLGKWVISGSCTSSPPPEPGCPAQPFPTMSGNATWSCPAASNQATTCVGTCVSGTQPDPISGAPTARCDASTGSWVRVGGACVPVVDAPCKGSALAANPAYSWPSSCQGASIADGTVCTASCNSGFSLPAGASPLRTRCKNGVWEEFTGRVCQSQGCDSQPTAAVTTNSTWKCQLPAAGMSTCTGGCLGMAASDVSNPPVAICTEGIWLLSSGTCTGGGEPGFFTFTATPDVIAAITARVESGVTRVAINSELESLPAIFAQYNISGVMQYTDIELATMYVVSTAPANGSNAQQTLTVAYQLRSKSNGLIPVQAERMVLAFLLEDQTHLGQLVSYITAAMAKSGLFPADFDYSTISVGFSAAGGTLGSDAPVKLGCNSQPTAAVTTNSTWKCQLPAAGMSTCTGGCLGLSASDVSNPPVATCFAGTWLLSSGTCTGGGEPGSCSFTATADVIAKIKDWVESGEARVAANEELESLPAIFAQSDMSGVMQYTDIELVSMYVVSTAPAARRGTRPRSNARETLTVGYQIRSKSKGLMPVEAERMVIVYLLQDPARLGQLTSYVTAALAKSGLFAADFDYSTIAIAFSAAGGTLGSEAPVTLGNCYLLMDGKQSPTTARKATNPKAAPAVCSDTRTLEAEFNTSMRQATVLKSEARVYTDRSLAVPDSTIACRLQSATGSSPLTKVYCSRKDGKPLSNGKSYWVALASSYSCGGDQLMALSSVPVVIRGGPQLTVAQQRRNKLTTCANSASTKVTFRYQLQDVDAESDQVALSAAISTNVKDLSCEAVVKKGTRTMIDNTPATSGTVDVTCTGSMTPGRKLDVTLQLTATPAAAGCKPVTTTTRQRINILCCKPGTGYARPRDAGQRKADCFDHFLPGTTDEQCVNAPPVILGPYNLGPAETILSLYEPGSSICTAKGKVGSVKMQCDDSNARQASFTIVSRSTDRAAELFVMLTCEPPPALGTCPGTVDWQPVRGKKNRLDVKVAGDKKTSTFVVDLRPKESCTCQNAVWAVYEYGMFEGLPPKQCSK